MKSGKHLCEDIIQAAQKVNIDPFETLFRPKDLGLRASDYGSFADWCLPAEAKSGKWNKHVCLRVAKRNDAGKPTQYILLPRENWQDHRATYHSV